MKKILFVCTGNLCRSPMAEGYLKHLLTQSGHDQSFKVSSAGTHAVTGSPPPAEACQVCQQNGFDISAHKAQAVTRELLDDADHVCLMEHFHKEFLLVLAPRAGEKFQLLSTWGKNFKKSEIPDPYGGDIEAYKNSLAGIRDCVSGLHQALLFREAK